MEKVLYGKGFVWQDHKVSNKMITECYVNEDIGLPPQVKLCWLSQAPLSMHQYGAQKPSAAAPADIYGNPWNLY